MMPIVSEFFSDYANVGISFLLLLLLLDRIVLNTFTPSPSPLSLGDSRSDTAVRFFSCCIDCHLSALFVDVL
jgi:hypothetical protein